MSQVVGLPNNSYKHNTNTAWIRARLCKLQKGCTPLASDKAYQLLAHGRWFSPGTPVSSTTKTGRHGIAEILLKVALSTINQFKPIDIYSIRPRDLANSYIISDLLMNRKFVLVYVNVQSKMSSVLKSRIWCFRGQLNMLNGEVSVSQVNRLN